MEQKTRTVKKVSGIKIPDSGELRAIAISSQDVTVEGSVPAELLDLAFEIVALQRKLQMKCDAYDKKSQNVKTRTIRANREETAELRRREREKRVAKETEKIEKTERREKYNKLTPMEKRFFRQTGLTPEEQLERMMAEARKFMAGFASE